MANANFYGVILSKAKDLFCNILPGVLNETPGFSFISNNFC